MAAPRDELIKRLQNLKFIQVRKERPDIAKHHDTTIQLPTDHVWDWAAEARKVKGQLQSEVRIDLMQAPSVEVDAPTPLASRKSFALNLEETVDLLHRRHVVFAHIPRNVATQHKSPPRRRTVTDPNAGQDGGAQARRAAIAVLSTYEGPMLTESAKRLLTQKSTTKKKALPAMAAATTADVPPVDTTVMELSLRNTFSPRREIANSPLPSTVQRCWFRTTAVNLSGATPAPDLPGVERPKRDLTQPTEAFLRQQGLTPEVKFHEGDGYIPPEVLLKRRREYKGPIELKRGEPMVRTRAGRRTNATPMPVPSSRTLGAAAGVFVREGDIGSYIRRDAREAACGLLKPDSRRSMKLRLGGSSGPRLL